MTADELRALLSELRLTQTEFAERYDTDRSAVVRWLQGERRVPGWVDTALTDLQHMRAKGVEWPTITSTGRSLEPEMMTEETELLLFVANFVRNMREFAIRQANGQLTGTAAAEIRKFDRLIEAVKRQKSPE